LARSGYRGTPSPSTFRWIIALVQEPEQSLQSPEADPLHQPAIWKSGLQYWKQPAISIRLQFLEIILQSGNHACNLEIMPAIWKSTPCNLEIHACNLEITPESGNHACNLEIMPAICKSGLPIWKITPAIWKSCCNLEISAAIWEISVVI